MICSGQGVRLTLLSRQGRSQKGAGGPAPQSTCLSLPSPINKLALLKTAAFMLNLNFALPPRQMFDLPKPTALPPALFPVFRFFPQVIGSLFSLCCLRMDMKLIIYCRKVGRQSLNLLIATLILIKPPSARHYIIKKLNDFVTVWNARTRNI